MTLRQQRVEAVEAGLRRELCLVALAAHGGEQPAHLGKRPAARPLDVRQRTLLVFEHHGQLVPDRSDLEHHHADRVRDDVVELARDSRALLGNRDARGRLALSFRLSRTDLCRFGLLRALSQDEPGDPGDREVDRDEDERTRVVSRDLADDERQTADDDE